MTKRWYLLQLLAAGAAVALSAACGPKSAGPEAAQNGPTSGDLPLRALSAPQLFAPGVVSTEKPEFATAFAPDGSAVYFNVASSDRSSLQLMRATAAPGSGPDGPWSGRTALPFSDGTYRDVDPFISPDGQRLYFSSDRPVSGTVTEEDFDTWYAVKRGDGWSELKNPGLPLNRDDADEIFVSVTSAGALYFSADLPGQERLGIFRALPDGDGFAEPEWLDLQAAGAPRDAEPMRLGNPSVSADGRLLLVVGPGNSDGDRADLYVSENQGDRWGPLYNLGPEINSGYSDFAPALSPDGRYLYFTSERPGVVTARPDGERPPSDIYWVEITRR
ncbi:MAG: hypothetical protein AAGC55_02715 [Myxococcota bacterium]